MTNNSFLRWISSIPLRERHQILISIFIIRDLSAGKIPAWSGYNETKEILTLAKRSKNRIHLVNQYVNSRPKKIRFALNFIRGNLSLIKNIIQNQFDDELPKYAVQPSLYIDISNIIDNTVGEYGRDDLLKKLRKLLNSPSKYLLFEEIDAFVQLNYVQAHELLAAINIYSHPEAFNRKIVSFNEAWSMATTGSFDDKIDVEYDGGAVRDLFCEDEYDEDFDRNLQRFYEDVISEGHCEVYRKIKITKSNFSSIVDY